MKKTFGGKEIFKQTDANRKTVHTKVIINYTFIMISKPTKDFLPTNSSLHIYTEDVAKIFKKALKNGEQN